jgi:hypothetical protein
LGGGGEDLLTNQQVTESPKPVRHNALSGPSAAAIQKHKAGWARLGAAAAAQAADSPAADGGAW